MYGHFAYLIKHFNASPSPPYYAALVLWESFADDADRIKLKPGEMKLISSTSSVSLLPLARNSEG